MKNYFTKLFIIGAIFITFFATSCANFMNGADAKKELEEKIEWASIKDYLEVSNFSPSYNTSGFSKDTPIEIIFNREINTETFTFTLLSPSGIDYSSHYLAPFFLNGNKVVKILPNTSNPISLTKGDILDLELTLSKTITDNNGIPLGQTDLKYNIRLNSDIDSTPPIITSINLLKTSNTNKNEIELSTLDFDTWDAQTEDIYSLNHVNNFYINCSVRDAGIGPAYIKIKEQLIRYTDGKKVIDTITTEQIYPVVFQQDSTDSLLYHVKEQFNLCSINDGLIKVTISVLDANYNESIQNNIDLYLLKDTNFNKSEGTIKIYNESGLIDCGEYAELDFTAWKKLFWSFSDGFCDTWYAGKSSAPDKFTYKIQTGPDTKNLNYESDLEVNKTVVEGNIVYYMNFDVLDESSINILVLNVYDEVGNPITQTSIIPEKPVYFGNHYYKAKPTTDSMGSFNLYKIPNSNNTNKIVESIEELNIWSSNWPSDEDYFGYFQTRDYPAPSAKGLYGPISELYEINKIQNTGITQSFLENLQYEYQFVNDGPNTGTHTLIISISNNQITDEQIKDLYVIYSLSMFPLNMYCYKTGFKKTQSGYESKITMPTSTDNDLYYNFAIVSNEALFYSNGFYSDCDTVFLESRTEKLPSFYNKPEEDNNSFIFSPTTYSNYIDFSNSVSKDATEINGKVTCFYQQGHKIDENYDSCNKIELSFAPEDLTSSAKSCIFSLSKFGYGVFNYVFMVTDKYGNSAYTNENILYLDKQLDQLSIKESIYDSYSYNKSYVSGTSKADGIKIKFTDSEETLPNNLDIFLNIYDDASKSFKELYRGDRNYLKYDSNHYYYIMGFSDTESSTALAPSSTIKMWIPTSVKDSYLKIYIRDINLDKYSAPKYLYIDTTNSKADLVKLKDIFNKTVFCDQPAIVNILYSENQLDENYDTWNKFGICSYSKIINGSESINTESVPENMYYVITATFADNTSKVSSVFKK